MKTITIVLIRIYQNILSPFLPPRCRFYPSCSSYSIQALERYSFAKGIYLSIKRISQCHPFSKGGFYPLEEKNEGKKGNNILWKKEH